MTYFSDDEFEQMITFYSGKIDCEDVEEYDVHTSKTDEDIELILNIHRDYYKMSYNSNE